MESSIFSGWSWEKITQAIHSAQSAPEGLAALAIVGAVMLAGIAAASLLTMHHLGGFYAHIRQEEEEQRLRDEQEAARRETEAEGEPGKERKE